MFRLWCLLIACVTARLSAQSFGVPDSETTQPPTSPRITALMAAAQRDGWPPQATALRSAALAAYRRGNLATANAWFHVYAWGRLWGLAEDDFVNAWIGAVNAAKVGHPNLPRTFPDRAVPLGARISPDMQKWLLTDGEFSDQFFALITPVDYLPRVFDILDTLYRVDPARFRNYPDLALAIAVVYDLPPPPYWPHSQVSATALPRKFPDPADAFAWWIRQDRLGRTFHRLNRLRADELKFVVDAAAPLSELEWAQGNVSVTLNDLPRAYSMIRYRIDRVTSEQLSWPGPTYHLADIEATGGICADQAYFATEVGKSHGVPTLFFYGTGNDARHAWFGFLDGDGNWQLDAGRYAEQRFVTGFARDPQTWREFSDHDLQFLQEHFRTQPSYRQSQVHAEFAADMLVMGDVAGAAEAARQAVNFEARNQGAWETLIEATRERGADARAVEAVMREAALAFHHYPDLEALYVSRVAESLRRRGQSSEADAEIRRIARKNQQARIDISVHQARDLVRRAMQTEPLPDQIRTYNSVVDAYGPGAGMTFFDDVVTAFVRHLVQLQHGPEALRAIDRARRTLAVEPKSQMETEFNKLQESVLNGLSENRPGNAP